MILPRTVAGVLAVCLSLTCLAWSQDRKKPAGRAKGVPPELTQADREVIVSAAARAARTHIEAGRQKGIRPDDIPAALWGDAVAKLKPIRVRHERANVA